MITIEGKGLVQLDQLIASFPTQARTAMSLALNQTAQRDAMRELKQGMMQEINFPKAYLQGDRMKVVKFANPSDLSTAIRGQGRPTMLYRFAVGAPVPRQKGSKRNSGITVRVKPSRTRVLPQAFVLKLKSGNLGIVVRSKSGLSNSRAARKIGKDLWLLYAPSVDQVMLNVAGRHTTAIRNAVAREFYRQFARLR